mmetsp:Transcript_1999/g.3625  ORF Transcript_1999/g.3625 Transcript_1999/m.3625 type:complete len:85 (-) Transcript_1999:1026-1280(-)
MTSAAMAKIPSPFLFFLHKNISSFDEFTKKTNNISSPLLHPSLRLPDLLRANFVRTPARRIPTNPTNLKQDEQKCRWICNHDAE